MIKTRIIPILLWKGPTQVISKKFDPWRTVGTMDSAVRIYEKREVDELVILDIGNRRPRYNNIIRYSSTLFCPLAIGGGVHSLEDIRQLLASGADKAIVCWRDLEFVHKASRKFGAQAITICLNVGWVLQDCAHTLAKIFEDYGAGEILLQSKERDGTMEGYDLGLIEKVAENVSIPVVAAGGCGTYEHMAEALRAGAHAVAAGAMFAFTDATPKGAAQYLAEKGFNVRLT